MNKIIRNLKSALIFIKIYTGIAIAVIIYLLINYIR
jgi:hypothetical protein